MTYVANNGILYLEVIGMGIIITDELIAFYAEEYKQKCEEGKVKNMNFIDYMQFMVYITNHQLGLEDEYFKALQDRYLKGATNYGKEEK